MGLKEMVAKVATWFTPTALREAFVEALGGSMLGPVAYGRPEDSGWVPITQRAAAKDGLEAAAAYRRDLYPLSQEQMLRVSHYLYAGNPLAQFLINVPVAMAVGRSVGYTLEYDHAALGISREEGLELAKQARRYLDPWWEHPAHDFKGRAQRYASTYLVTGELLMVIPTDGVNPTTGLFVLDYIDSALIHNVEGKNGLATTPGRVFVRQTGKDHMPFEVMLPTVDGAYKGECFFFRHTGRLNALRGTSDLLAQADWIDLHGELLFGRVDKAILANTLVHDLTVSGVSDENQIKAEADKFAVATSKPAGIFAHNDRVKHEIKKADLSETDSAHLLRAVLLHVLGSKGYPEHWFADGGQSNKSSAGEQSDIAYKMLEGLQEELLQVFALPLTVAYDALAEKQSIFPKRSTGAVILHPNLPKISERDISRIGGVIANVEGALDAAVAAGRLSRRTAARVTLTIIEKLTGEHVDADDEAIQVEIERAEAEQAEMEKQQAAAKAAMDLAAQVGDEPADEAGVAGEGDAAA